MKDWDDPDPSRLLFVAMKNWDSSFFRSRAEEVKFGQRQLVALEFINVWVLFYFLYVGAADGPVIPGIIVTRIIFFKITLKAIQVLLLF